MVNIARVLVAVAIGALAFAAPAAADSDSWVQRMQEQYVFLSEQRIHAEAAKICTAARGGTPASEIVMMVRDDLGVSVPAAYEITSTAIIEFGC